MKLYSENKNYKLYHGDMNELNSVIENNSIDCIITDPPYELGFMGKGWDASGVAFRKETWKHCYYALKPGGYLLAFGGSRTFHRIACAIEDAGFEIRDTICWLYGSGFPKSMNIGLAVDKKNGVESEIVGNYGTMPDFHDVGKKQEEISGINKRSFGQVEDAKRTEYKIYKAQNEWNGWGTCLKPSFEPIIIARKPCEGTTTDNVLKYGVGGLNIDECRVPMQKSDIEMINAKSSKNATDNYNRNETKKYGDYALNIATSANELGRFPANTILTYDNTDYNEVCGGMPIDNGYKPHALYSNIDKYDGYGSSISNRNGEIAGYGDSGSASRYFYCAKASKRDRDEGLEEFALKTKVFNGESNESSKDIKDAERRFTTKLHNVHPCVKPTSLIQYLVRLVAPKGTTILDPFMGSGSTGKAVMYENNDRNKDYKFIGIELTDEYLPIAKARIDYAIVDKETIDEIIPTIETKAEVKKNDFERFSWDV